MQIGTRLVLICCAISAAITLVQISAPQAAAVPNADPCTLAMVECTDSCLARNGDQRSCHRRCERQFNRCVRNQ